MPTDNQTPVVPEWAETTPADHSYSLDMYENGDHSVQTIEITREEFIEVKQYIARMRGFLPAEEVNDQPTHPPISQTELAGLFELGEARDAWAISIRNRLAVGVPVEPGVFVADVD